MKILKILANKVQQYIKGSMHQDQVQFIPGIKINSIFKNQEIHHINKLKKSHMVISIDTENTLDKIQYLLMIKLSEK